jgi:hypothetical protein
MCVINMGANTPFRGEIEAEIESATAFPVLSALISIHGPQAL